jgi:hypothetical protein
MEIRTRPPKEQGSMDFLLHLLEFASKRLPLAGTVSRTVQKMIHQDQDGTRFCGIDFSFQLVLLECFLVRDRVVINPEFYVRLVRPQNSIHPVELIEPLSS